ncbi:MAG: hypothetical protein KIT11_04980 [Fimbriimonadaceae bacterium]|nr:hypothetical protein [Fimbriimonadaceae bacterium]QYK56752.1 MAG: hypothetical protein KF733_04540 [Fimbriimonadaceae bacterium]
MRALGYLAWLFAAVTAVVLAHSALALPRLGGARADLPLVVALLSSAYLRPAGSASVGFLVGVLEGCLRGADLVAYGVSRTLVSFAAAFVGRTELKMTPFVAGLIVLVGTVLIRLLHLFLAPPSDMGGFLTDTIGTAIYNGVLAALFDLVVRRVARREEG